MRNSHELTNIIAITLTNLFLGSLLIAPVQARAAGGLAPHGVLELQEPREESPWGDVALEDVRVDVQERVEAIYGEPRTGDWGRFEMDIDMLDSDFDIWIRDEPSRGSVCEIHMSHAWGQLDLEYSEECEVERLLDVIEEVFPGVVDTSVILGWMESEGSNGSPGSDNDASTPPGIDNSIGRVDNSGADCGLGQCVMDAAVVFGVAVAVGSVCVPAGFAVALVGGIGVGMKCTESRSAPECTQNLVEDLLTHFEQAMGLDINELGLDIDQLIEYLESLVRSVLSVEEYVPSEGTVGIGMIYDQADATMELDTLVLPLVVESQH
jgi:hypothetical protein